MDFSTLSTKKMYLNMLLRHILGRALPERMLSFLNISNHLYFANIIYASRLKNTNV